MTNKSVQLLVADAVAGVSVAFILLPEAVAYAEIAHLPIQSAVIAALVGMLCYAWLGGCSFAIVAPTSSAAALLAAVVHASQPANAQHARDLAFALVILTGGGLLIFAKAGLGRLSAFVSRPVLRGFSFALALTIIIKQLPKLLGVSVTLGDPWHIVLDLSTVSDQLTPWSPLLGGLTLLLLGLLKRWPLIPGAFVVLLLGIVLSSFVNLAAFQINLVGALSLKSIHLDLPELPLEKWLQLSEVAFGLLVIIVAESWGSIRGISLNHGNSVEPNRELFALGLANLASGLFQGMPVGAGFSASNANEAAGARSKLSSVFAAGVLLLMGLYGRHWIGLIPEPMVAAAVIHVLSHALNPHALLQLWRMNRDQYLALAAVAAVLVFGVLHGMLIAIALSLANAIRSFSQPVVKELAEIGDSRDYVDKLNHPSAQTHPGIIILRPEEPLFFASADGILSEVRRRLKSRPEVTTLILSLEESANLDSTAAESLLELAVQLQQQQKTLLLARVKDPISELMLNLANDRFADRLFWSVADAVAFATSRQ